MAEIIQFLRTLVWQTSIVCYQMSRASMVKELSDMRWGSTRLLVSIILFCSVELLQISNGNAVLPPEEENALDFLRERFNLLNWTGDPCESANWIECSNDSQSSHVSTLKLANLNLSGTIPPEIAKLRNIEDLFLFHNSLHGPIPDLSNMTKLRNMDLKENNLTGQILNTSAFTNLTRIVLDDNNLTGVIPETLFNHPTLQLLYVGNNPVGGSLPNMSGLTGIKELSLHNLEITGSIPESIKHMTQATQVKILFNPRLTGPIPNMSALTKIEHFQLNNCAYNGSLPTLEDSPDVVNVRLDVNNFSGYIPPALFQHEKVRWMNLNNNSQLSGEIPDTSRLLVVENFYVNDCNLTGSVPSFKTNLELKYTGLQNNRLTKIPPDFRHLKNLIVMDVSNNSITGNLPDFHTSDQITSLCFDNNYFSGGIPISWTGLTGLTGLKLQYNNLTGVLQKEIGNLTSLKKLYLNNNNFSGSIPEELANLSKLETLDLSNNHFSGIVPEELADLPNLRTLFLENNRFTGIPEALINLTGKGLNLTYDANVMILTGKSKSDSGVSAGVIAGVVAGLGALGAVIVVFTVLLFRFKRTKKHEGQLSKDGIPKSAMSFTLKEIKNITGNYKRFIGKGGFGPVYHGKLQDSTEVAVKVRAPDSRQGGDEFLNEVRLLSRLHHRNLVPLVGYCLEGQQQILVYEYMAQGSLHDHLYNTGSDPLKTEKNQTSARRSLSWKTRLDIAVNAGRGIQYLHTDCTPPIIHRDVKASNILLADNLRAKIADLGLSKQVPEPDSEGITNTSGISTAVKGTFGYLDPEYFVRHKLTTKSDVFSFGMVLLEIITGKRPQCEDFPGTAETSLVEWVQGRVNADQLKTIVDPAMGDEYNRQGMLRVIRMALSCVLPDSAERPDMGRVLLSLTEACEMENESLTNGHTGITVPYSSQLNTPVTSSSFTESLPVYDSLCQQPSDTVPR